MKELFKEKHFSFVETWKPVTNFACHIPAENLKAIFIKAVCGKKLNNICHS